MIQCSLKTELKPQFPIRFCYYNCWLFAQHTFNNKRVELFMGTFYHQNIGYFFCKIAAIKSTQYSKLPIKSLTDYNNSDILRH